MTRKEQKTTAEQPNPFLEEAETRGTTPKQLLRAVERSFDLLAKRIIYQHSEADYIQSDIDFMCRRLLIDVHTLPEEELVQVLSYFQDLIIVLYDILVVDLMVDWSDNNKFQSLTGERIEEPMLISNYFRDDATKENPRTALSPVDPRISYFTNQEFEYMRGKGLLESGRQVSLDTFFSMPVEKLSDQLDISITDEVGLDQLGDVQARYDEIMTQFPEIRGIRYPQVGLRFHVSLGDDLKGVVLWNSGDWLLYPLSPVQSQDVYKALLEQGIEFDLTSHPKFYKERDGEPVRNDISKDEFWQRWDEILENIGDMTVKMSRAQQKSWNQSQMLLDRRCSGDYQDLLARRTQQYDRFFSREHPHLGRGTTLITRSGVSATHLASLAIQEQLA